MYIYLKYILLLTTVSPTSLAPIRFLSVLLSEVFLTPATLMSHGSSSTPAVVWDRQSVEILVFTTPASERRVSLVVGSSLWFVFRTAVLNTSPYLLIYAIVAVIF